ncbi:BTAD domain-containing putative transcriptional regulator [Actinoplanes sp. NPDC048796]|uniref:AfsR/SARP family transcriptional regulator n=1 Tax=Actinoplanes sp. NPDC048796 TaxID=3155640 RepID=UPI0033C8D610
MGDPAVRVVVFGGLRVWRDGDEVDLGSVRRRMVLATLLAARGSAVGLAELIDTVWGEEPSPSAPNQLHRLIGQIRRLFEPELPIRAAGRWVLPVGDGYRLIMDSRACDLMTFFELTASGGDDQRRFERLLRLAVDPPFAGLPEDLLERPAFVAVRAARAQMAVDAADLAIGNPRARDYLPLLEQYAAGNPLHEPLQARLIRLLTVVGRRAEALVLFEQVRRRLAEELGVDPGPELRAAHLAALADPASADPHRPAQLPPRLPGFTAREDLSRALDDGDSPIVALIGMGGTGKTSLAIDWAHRLAPDYPDGQLYLNLRGFDPAGRPTPPLEALTTLLESVGVDPASVGDSLDARSARFRSAVADRKMIVLLDNARDSEQVRPLLPGSAGCRVIVTSRNQLTGLVAREAARPVPVGRLGAAASRQLLNRRLGPSRLADEPAATDEIIRLCAGLPLALSVAAARLAVNAAAKLADVAAELDRRRLDALATGEPADDLRSALSWSYATLTAPAARMFRHLAVHSGADFAADSAASVAGLDEAGTRRTLAELTVTNMLTELGAGRYTVHDLLHAYAGELLTGDERMRAERRLVDHYTHSAHNAYLTTRRPPAATLGPPPAGVVPATFTSFAEAAEWYVRERAALAGAIDLAHARGWWREAALMIVDLRPIRGQILEPLSASRDQTLRVLDAAGAGAEPGLHATLLREASIAVRGTDPGRAYRFLEEALSIAERAGDLAGQAQLHRSLSEIPSLHDDGSRLRHAYRAVELGRSCGEPIVLMFALVALAQRLDEAGDIVAAEAPSREAFQLSLTVGTREDQGMLAARLADLTSQLGDYGTAVEMAEVALQHTLPQDTLIHLPLLALLAEARLRCGDPVGARSAVAAYQQLVGTSADAYVEYVGQAEFDRYQEKADAVLAELEGR